MANLFSGQYLYHFVLHENSITNVSETKHVQLYVNEMKIVFLDDLLKFNYKFFTDDSYQFKRSRSKNILCACM